MKTRAIAVVLCLTAFALSARAQCWDPLWSEANVQPLGKVDFINDQQGWAIRSPMLGSASILHTTDGGVSWTVQYSSSYALSNVDFVDASHGWAVGYYSIFRTTNGGATWTRTALSDATMSGVCFIDANNGWVVGDNLMGGDSPIWHTTNGGASWTPQSSGTIYGLNEVSFFDGNHGVAVGLGGTILNTTNGGTNWVNRASGTTYALSGVSMPTEIFACAVGAHGTALGTFDGGDTWSAAVTVGTTAYLYDVSFCGSENGWIVGDSALVLYTASLGFIWTRQHSSPGLYPLLLGISCAGDLAWAVGYEAAGTNLVLQNACPAPHNVVIHYVLGPPPFGLPFMSLAWNPTGPAGMVTYNIYEDSLFNGPYLTLTGSTTDTAFGWLAPGPAHRFYVVKAETP